MFSDASRRLDPESLAQLVGLDLRARVLVDGVMSGAHRSGSRGSSVEFAQHRAYVPGDDTRRVDWKVLARSDRLQVRQFHQESTLALTVVVDGSGSMAYRGAGAPWAKIDMACLLAGALCHLAMQQRDPVRVCLSSASEHPYSGFGSHARHVQMLLQMIDEIQPTEQTLPLHELLHQVKEGKRGLTVIISDCLDDPDLLREELVRLRHQGHDVMLLQVLDPDEMTLPFKGDTRFEGLEGEPMLAADAAALRRSWQDVFEQHQQQLIGLCRHLRIDHLTLRTDQSPVSMLTHFLNRRQASGGMA